MEKRKKNQTREKIKRCAIKLFNENETLSITTNHIAKEAGISPGNLYYHYKNKEEIIREIYSDMSDTYENFNSFELIMNDENPLKQMSQLYDKLSIFFWEYRFLIRDSALLMALDKKLKEHFNKNQEKRISQIEKLLRFLISQDIIHPIKEEELHIRAKLNWFIITYWQVFASTMDEVTLESIKEGINMNFKIQIEPFLTQKGKKLHDF